MYTLRKIKLEKHSALPEGYVSKLGHLTLFDCYDNKQTIENAKLEDVQEGYQVILTGGGYHRTSHIAEVITKEESKVVFKTQTSIYELTETDDD